MDTKKTSPGLRVLKIALTVLLGLILALCVGVFALWHNELSTLFSIRQLNGPDDAHRDGAVYQMKVSGGYYFDEFLAQGGASKDSDLIAFITQRITKGLIPMDIGESDIGCSSFTAATPAGDRLFARNYDFSRTNTCIVYTDPGHGRHASVSTVDLQFIGIDQDSVPQGLMDKAGRALCAPGRRQRRGAGLRHLHELSGSGGGYAPHRPADGKARPHLHHHAPHGAGLRHNGGGGGGAHFRL